MGEHAAGTVLFNARYITRPSAHDFIRGACSAFNLSGSTRQEYWFTNGAHESDVAAVLNDWEAVGGDMCDAMAAAG